MADFSHSTTTSETLSRRTALKTLASGIAVATAAVASVAASSAAEHPDARLFALCKAVEDARAESKRIENIERVILEGYGECPNHPSAHDVFDLGGTTLSASDAERGWSEDELAELAKGVRPVFHHSNRKDDDGGFWMEVGKTFEPVPRHVQMQAHRALKRMKAAAAKRDRWWEKVHASEARCSAYYDPIWTAVDAMLACEAHTLEGIVEKIRVAELATEFDCAEDQEKVFESIRPDIERIAGMAMATA